MAVSLFAESQHRKRPHKEATSAPKAPRMSEPVYPRGAIVRLRLHNFLTFDDVEIHPNAQLNVIVGPNGTGKSSLVCAICLGLGGHPKLLGRAKEIKDFVKHGKEEGYVELQLHNDRGRNPVIRRMMKIQDNSSTWLLNGKQVLLKEITKVVQDMHIQLDNRCQFLPQDMVVEFAKMNTVQLLEETEKAIGRPEMYESHCKLKELKSDQTTFQQRLSAKEQELVQEQRKNQLLARDVERFRNYQEYCTSVKQLEKKKCWVEYSAKRVEYGEVKEVRKVKEKELKTLQRRHQPIRDKCKEQEEIVSRCKQIEKEKVQALHSVQRQVDQKQHQLVSLEDDLEAPRQELEQKRKEEQQRKRKIENCRREIQGFKHELEKLESPESLQPKFNEKNARIRTIAQEVTRINSEQASINLEKQPYEDQIRRAEDELHQMQDIRNQRLREVQRRDRETYEAIMWLRSNQHRFKQPIMEPIAVVVNIRDLTYAAQIEAMLSGRDFFSFVTQNPEDHEAFLSEVRDRQGKRINVVRAPNHPLSNYKPEIPLAELQRYGFGRMLIDLIDAPEPVLRYFCQYHGLHQVPIADRLTPDQLERVTTRLSRLRRFFTQTSSYMVKKSLYADKTSVRNSDLRPATFLVGSEDPQRKSELEQEIREAQQSLGVFDGRYKELEEKGTALRQEDNRIRIEKTDLRKIVDARRKLQSNISSRQTVLEQLQGRSFDLHAEEEKCEQAVERIQQKRVDTIGKIKLLLQECVLGTVERVKAGLHVRSGEMRVDWLLHQYRQAKNALDAAEHEVESQKSREEALKNEAQSLLRKAQQRTGLQSPDQDPQLLEAFSNFPGDLEGIEELIHEYQAQAEMCRGTDDSVVKEYETREKRIAELQGEIEGMKSGLEDRSKRMEELKESWLVPLKELVEKVNEKFKWFFEQMHCAGEVKLHEDEDFTKYGVKIRVKFRDSEELQELNAQRQSGGERSVSTMLYLMALQGITSCPFRVVDEINQGMDPENERRVFDLIVQTASERGTGGNSQYFLLTPKLLQNLSYTEAAMVHVVHNGQEMAPFRQWDMAKFLD